MDFIDLSQQNYSYLGENTKASGEFHFAEIQTTIAGQLQGKIFLHNKASTLILEPESRVEGEIDCYQVIILGHFNGVIKSQASIVIRPTAVVSGNLSAQNISIDPGAIVNVTLAAEQATNNLTKNDDNRGS